MAGTPDSSTRSWASDGACSYCGHSVGPGAEQCPRCGAGGRASSEDIRRFGAVERRGALRRKASADLLFLAGLLVGGPLLSFGSHAQLGLFICLGGALASVLRRYTPWSLVGTLVIGGLASAAVSAWVFEPAPPEASPEEGEEVLSPVQRREVFSTRLARRLQDEGILLEARGPDLVTLWFYLPTVEGRECGEYPEAELRGHLAQLGFARVVVSNQNSARGICSFEP